MSGILFFAYTLTHRPMKQFDNTELWEVLKSSGDLSSGMSIEMDDLIDKFIADVHIYCREEKDMAERGRSLNYLRGKLIVYIEDDSTDTKLCAFLRRLIRQVINFIDSEIELVKLEIEYPERFITFLDDPVPLARWNGKLAELLEYVMPLQLSGKILKPSGEPMAFTEVVRIFESLLGITIDNPNDIKMRLLARKKNVTPFIDKMKYAIKEAAEKVYQ